MGKCKTIQYTDVSNYLVLQKDPSEFRKYVVLLKIPFKFSARIKLKVNQHIFFSFSAMSIPVLFENYAQVLKNISWKKNNFFSFKQGLS